MIKYDLEELFRQTSVDKQIHITFDGGEITNSEIVENDFSCNEILSSMDTLVFGACESNHIEFTCLNNGVSLEGKELVVTLVLNGQTNNPFSWGRYKVLTDKPSADRLTKTVVAYDVMDDIINADVAEWYNSLTFPITIKNFRNSFFDYLGVLQVSTNLVNDNVKIEKTIEVETLSGKDVVTAICEINCVFGNINRDGKFRYVTMEAISTGLYPSNTFLPSDDIFPREKISDIYDISAGKYISLDYEDWRTDVITGLTIATKENDIGVSVGTDKNVYEIVGNFLVYGKGEDELTDIANRVLEQMEKVAYHPYSAEVFGNPCVEVGDAVSFVTKNGTIVNTYVLERTLTGIQAIYDSISANGTKEVEKGLNTLDSKVKQLLGKSNVFERTIDETRSEITKVENNLVDNYPTTVAMRSEIRQSAESIESNVSKSYSTKKELSDSIDGVNTKFGDYSTTAEMNSAISQTAENITSTVSANYTTKQEYNDLKNIVDGNVASYEGAAEPTLSNYPANQWTTEDERKRHVGALYIITKDNPDKAGWQYRFSKPSTGWEWTLLSNSDVQKAIKDAQDALTAAGAVADNLSANYSTTTQMNSAISQSADNIKLDVSKTYSTKTEVDGEIKGVRDTLKSYSTTTEMNSAITLSETGIKSDVSKTYSTKTETSKAISDGLKDYVTEETFNSSLDQKSDEISMNVAATQGKWVLGDVKPYVYSIGYPPKAEYKYNNKTCLDVTNGILYKCTYSNGVYSWTAIKDDFKTVEGSLRLKIERDGLNGIAAAIEGTADIIKFIGGKFTVDCENFSIDGDGIATLSGLEVGKNVTMGSNAKISWDNVTGTSGVANKSDIPTKTSELDNDSGLAYAKNVPTEKRITEISQHEISVADLNADHIKSGSIESIDVNAKTVTATSVFNMRSTLTGTKVAVLRYLTTGTLQIDGVSEVQALPFMLLRRGGSVMEGFDVSGGLNADSVSSSGNISSDATVVGNDVRTRSTQTASASNAYLTSNGTVRKWSGSSKRWKHDITDEINEENNPERLYDLEVVQYKYDDNHLEDDCVFKGKDLVGFIAEDVYEKYQNAAMYEYDEDDNVLVNDWNAQLIIPPMLKLIQDQKKQIDALEERLARLEKALR